LESIEKINLKDIVVLTIRLSHSTLLETKKFKNIIDEEIKSGNIKLIIDLTECEHIDSTFLGSIMMIYQKLNELGGKLKIVEPANPNEDIFDVTKTHELFDMYKTREAALKGF